MFRTRKYARSVASKYMRKTAVVETSSHVVVVQHSYSMTTCAHLITGATATVVMWKMSTHASVVMSCAGKMTTITVTMMMMMTTELSITSITSHSHSSLALASII